MEKLKMINIDGSYGEGGGQILRTCLTLSAITGQPFRLLPIRPHRKKPGLMPQHLMACIAVNQICRGKLEGAELASRILTFQPGAIQGGEYEFDIGTAGSSILLAQTIIPIFLYASETSRIRIIGGTHVTKSPSYDYFEQIFLPAIARFGAHVKAKLIKAGYYPKGGGLIEFEITPQRLHGCTQWNVIANLFAIIRLSRLPQHIAERESQILMQHDIKEIKILAEDSFSAGNAITLCKGFKGSYMPGEIGKKAEQVAEEAYTLLNEEEGADIDKHLADQLLIYAVLAEGQTVYTTSKITEHLNTNIFIIRQFIKRSITIEGNRILVEE